MPERRRYERTPDTIVMLVAVAVTGTVLTLMGEVPRSIFETTPRWAGIVWSVAFSAAALITLAGVLYREPMTGWLLELVGRAGLAIGALGYVAALAEFATSLRSGWMIAFVGGVGVASGWRVVQLTRRVIALRAALKASQP